MSPIKIASFNIFDTCLSLSCGNNIDFFDILADEVFNGPVSEKDKIEFKSQRRNAVGKTIDEIYDTLHYNHPLLKPSAELAHCEYQCLKRLTKVILSSKELITSLIDTKYSIFVINNTKYPINVISDLLVSNGLPVLSNAIFQGSLSDLAFNYFDTIEKKNEIKEWIHFGNISPEERDTATKYGINHKYILPEFLPYEKKWVTLNYGINYKYSSVLTGICRSIYLSLPEATIKPFSIDIAAPFLTSFAYRILKNAENRRISRIYFCSRDCYSLFHAANELKPLFPQIEIHYFYTSRQAQYEGTDNERLKYYKSIQLASSDSKAAIVDIRSTGRTLQNINQLLENNGYNSIFGYFFEMFCNREYIPGLDYYCEINAINSIGRPEAEYGSHDAILECMLSMCPDHKIAGYKDGVPLFCTDDTEDPCIIKIDRSNFSIHETIVRQFAKAFVDTGLYNYNDELFENLIIPNFTDFLINPLKEYLVPFQYVYIKRNNDFRPYIERKPKCFYSLTARRLSTNSVIMKKIYGVLLRHVIASSKLTDDYWEKGSINFSLQ